MRYAVCSVPVSALRIESSHKTEMVSQQLFGECCTILEEVKGWVKIRCRYDDYEGWCQSSHVVDIDVTQFESKDEQLTADWINDLDYNGHHMFVPLGSSLTAFQNDRTFWRKSPVQYSGKVWHLAEVKITPKLMKHLVYKFLNTSYLWGGKSVFGIDCSGFSQLVYKLLNIAIPRDASQQALKGNTIEFIQEVNCGDLAFFDNDEGIITHVGIILNEHEIIHASGKVRLDKIDHEGILNVDSKQRTHKLRIIKRFF